MNIVYLVGVITEVFDNTRMRGMEYFRARFTMFPLLFSYILIFCACRIEREMLKPSAMFRAFYTSQTIRAVRLDRHLSAPPEFDESRNVSTNLIREFQV
jgi:hypothetical protein